MLLKHLVGVGIFIKDTLFNIYDIVSIDELYDGIHGIKVSDKSTGFTCIIYNCYLAQYTSVYVNKSTDFFRTFNHRALYK